MPRSRVLRLSARASCFIRPTRRASSPSLRLRARWRPSSRRWPAFILPLAELAAEGMAVFGGAIDVLRKFGRPHLHPLQFAAVAVFEVAFDLPALLVQPGFRYLGGARGRLDHLFGLFFGLGVCVRVALGGISHRLRTLQCFGA